MIAIRSIQHEGVAEREAVLLQALQSDKTKHIIKLIDVIRLKPNESPLPLESFPEAEQDAGFTIRSIMCLVTEYFEGLELLEYVQKKNFLKEDVAAKIFRQLLLALQSIHNQGIVHRDLKLENLLINANNKEIKLIDFGLGQFLDTNTKLRDCVGSAVYCAPEVFNRTGYCGYKADIWSCGVILYAMVSGEFPWEFPNSASQFEQMSRGNWLAPVASPLCVEFIETMMQVNPERRLTIPELLQHPWMQKFTEAKPKESSPSKLCSFVEVIKSHTPFVSIHA